MIRLCAWCKKDLDTGRILTDQQYEEASKTGTHGICPECAKQMKLSAEQAKSAEPASQMEANNGE